MMQDYINVGKKVLYIDIDGVLLGKNDSESSEVVLAKYAKV